jgi:threonine dehydrogenase-like Zn-dependent dehydrogenase
MVVFGGEEVVKRLQCGGDGFTEKFRLLQLPDIGLRDFFLLVVGVENGGALLATVVRALAVALHGMMRGEKYLEQRAEADNRGVVRDLHRLGMLGRPGRHDFVVGSLGGAAGIAAGVQSRTGVPPVCRFVIDEKDRQDARPTLRDNGRDARATNPPLSLRRCLLIMPAMKALVWEGPRLMNVREMPEPKPAAEEVLIHVAYSGICGSELSGYLGHNTLRVPPLVMGHEFSGKIAALGERAGQINPRLAVGARVTVNPLIHNPWSRASRRGRPNLCRDRKIIGIHRPGSYADLVTAPATNVHPLADGLSLEKAALSEPLACAVEAVELSGCTPADSMLITGLGPIGLLALIAAKNFGVRRLYATDTDPDRRAIGEKFGARVLDPKQTRVVDLIQKETAGEGVDVASDAVGAAATRRECLEAVARGGTVVFVGLHDEESPLPANLIARAEITVRGSFAFTPRNFETALDWLTNGLVEIDPWLVKAPLAEGRGCFERLLGKPGPVAKILLCS